MVEVYKKMLEGLIESKERLIGAATAYSEATDDFVEVVTNEESIDDTVPLMVGMKLGVTLAALNVLNKQDEYFDADVLSFIDYLITLEDKGIETEKDAITKIFIEANLSASYALMRLEILDILRQNWLSVTKVFEKEIDSVLKKKKLDEALWGLEQGVTATIKDEIETLDELFPEKLTNSW